MTKYTTYLELMQILQDIQVQSAQSITYGLFHGNKIRSFYQLNKLRIDMMNENFSKIRDKYTKKDEAGRPVIIVVDKIQQLDFNNDEDKNSFESEYSQLMQKEIQINI